VVLSDFVEITVGYPFRGKIPEQHGTGIYAVQMKDVISANQIGWASCVETELQGKKKPAWLKVGDVLVVSRGSKNYAALVGSDAERIKAVASPHFFVLSNFSEKVSPQYIQWFINQSPSQNYFQREAEGTLTKSIRRSVLENLPIAVPSIEKQEQIVQLYMTMWQEQIFLKQLTLNSEKLMSTIAKDLLKESKQSEITK